MTRIATRKTRLQFETDATVRDRSQERPIIVTVMPRYCLVRTKGKRASFPIFWSTIFEHAVKIATDHARAERKKARRAR